MYFSYVAITGYTSSLLYIWFTAHTNAKNKLLLWSIRGYIVGSWRVIGSWNTVVTCNIIGISFANTSSTHSINNTKQFLFDAKINHFYHRHQAEAHTKTKKTSHIRNKRSHGYFFISYNFCCKGVLYCMQCGVGSDWFEEL